MENVKSKKQPPKKLKTSRVKRQESSPVQQKELISESELENEKITVSPYEAKAARKKAISSIVLSILFALCVGIPLGFLVNLKMGIILGVIPPIFFLSYQYPRIALWAFLIYMPFGGTVVYWLGEGNSLVQLIKDVLYLPALIGLIQECRRKRLPIFVSKPLKITLGLIFFVCLMNLFFVVGVEQFAPDCSSFGGDLRVFDDNGIPIVNEKGQPILILCRSGIPLLQGLIGLKVLLGYVPLIFCAFYLVDTREKLIWFGRIFVILAIICCSLGLIQFYLLKTGHCVGTRLESGSALFKASKDAKCLVGGALLYSPQENQIRLPGTFVSPWHWSWFLVANAMICFTVTLSEKSVIWRFVSLSGLALVQINAIICGQRLAFLLVPITIIIQFILTGQIANLKRFLPVGIALGVFLFLGFFFLNPEFIQARLDSFVGRWNQASPITFWLEQMNVFSGGLLGNGLGKGTNSARTFGSVFLIETFHPKVMFEIGYLGLTAFMIFITHLIVLTFKAYRSLRDPSLRSFGLGFWIFILLIGYFPYWYPLDTDPVAVYYWLLAGIIFRLPLLDRQEKIDKVGETLTSIKKVLKTPLKPNLI